MLVVLLRLPRGAVGSVCAWSRVQWVRLVGVSPLVRRRDRLAVWLVVAAVVAATSAIPAAVWVGGAAQRRAVATAQAQLHTRHLVTVTTIEAASSPLTGPDPGAITVAVQWWWPDGHHSGRIAVPTGTEPGTHFRKWVDESGRLTGAPVTMAEARATAGRASLAVWAWFVLALVFLGHVIRNMLTRAHHRGWDRDHSNLFGRDDR